MSSIFHFIPPSYYGTVYIYAILALCVAFIVRYSGSRGQQLLHKPERPPILAIVLAMALIVFMGFRQGLYNFGDSYFYAHSYNNVIDDYE